MKDIVWNFSKPDDLVVSAFAVTLSTAKGCQSLYRHGRFFECDKEKSMTVVVDVYDC